MASSRECTSCTTMLPPGRPSTGAHGTAHIWSRLLYSLTLAAPRICHGPTAVRCGPPACSFSRYSRVQLYPTTGSSRGARGCQRPLPGASETMLFLRMLIRLPCVSQNAVGVVASSKTTAPLRRTPGRVAWKEWNVFDKKVEEANVACCRRNGSNGVMRRGVISTRPEPQPPGKGAVCLPHCLSSSCSCLKRAASARHLGHALPLST